MQAAIRCDFPIPGSPSISSQGGIARAHEAVQAGPEDAQFVLTTNERPLRARPRSVFAGGHERGDRAGDPFQGHRTCRREQDALAGGSRRGVVTQHAPARGLHQPRSTVDDGANHGVLTALVGPPEPAERHAGRKAERRRVAFLAERRRQRA